MGDYMFMLESHLNPAQNRVVKQVQQIAAEAGFNIYITGGAMRDMIGGFPIRNLDFTMEGKTLKIAKKLTDSLDAQLVRYDNTRHIAHLLFPGGVTVRISMARKETYPKAGGPPKVAAATIHEDLLGRDFTVNAIALSLNAASLGLLIDPANGVADIERRELSTTYNYSLYDDPVRMLRLIRYKIRLGYEISEKTLRQLENARLAGVETMIPAYKLRTELRHIANDPCRPSSPNWRIAAHKLFSFRTSFPRRSPLGKFCRGDLRPNRLGMQLSARVSEHRHRATPQAEGAADRSAGTGTGGHRSGRNARQPAAWRRNWCPARHETGRHLSAAEQVSSGGSGATLR